MNHEEGPEHNRCCLISKIIERLSWIPWQRSPYVLLALEERQGRIRSAEVHCALWNSTLKQHQGREEERVEVWRGGVGDTQVEISGAAQPVFFFLFLFSFTLVSWKREHKRNTPESGLQSNYFEQWKKKEVKGEWEREKCMRIAILSYSLHTGCITTSLKKSLRHNKTDCIITFFFFPLQGAFLLLFTPPPKRSMYCWSTLWWEQKKKKERKERKAEQGCEEREDTVNTHFCQGILVKKSKETKGADGWRWS